MATLHVRRLIVVVRAARQAAANTRAKLVDTAGGERTFTAGLYPTGSVPGTPPTHYWCGWSLVVADDSNIRARLQQWVDDGTCWVFNGNTRTPESLMAEFGFEPARPVGAI